MGYCQATRLPGGGAGKRNRHGRTAGLATHGRGVALKRKGILALAIAAAGLLTIGAGVAFAAHKYSTKIVFLGNSGPSSNPSDQTFYGDLNSNSKCLGARKVGLFKQTSGGDFKLIDVDLSSFNGAFALRAEINGAPKLAIQVAKDKRNNGKVVCKSATLSLAPAQAGSFKVG
jgi:hypothetical protein